MGPNSLFTGLIETIIIGLLIMSNAKYLEIAIGKTKLIVILLITYALTGFALTGIPKAIIGGPYVILAILMGMLGYASFKKDGPLAVISQAKLIVPTAALILIPLFDSNMYNYLVLLLAFSISACMMYL